MNLLYRHLNTALIFPCDGPGVWSIVTGSSSLNVGPVLRLGALGRKIAGYATCMWRVNHALLKPFADDGDEVLDAQRLHNHHVGLLEDGFGGALHLGICAEDDGGGVGAGVAHGADYSEAVAVLWHVKIADQHVEGPGSR